MNTTVDNLLETAISKHQSGRLEEAVSIYEFLLNSAPRDSKILFLLALAYSQLKMFSHGIELFDRVLKLSPDHLPALINRSIALKNCGRYQEAISGFDRVISINPCIAEVYLNKGNALFELRRIEESIACFEKSIEINRNCADVYLNRGIAYMDLKLLDRALSDFDKAISLDPADPEPYFNKALLLILTGKYSEGWKLYEWRTKRLDSKAAYYSFASPSWAGEVPVSGKRILVYSEQGFGDIIQFCRYLPKLAEAGAQIFFEVPKDLAGLVSTLNCKLKIVTQGDALPEFDLYCPLLSLPYAFKTTLETIPATVPYLFSQNDKAEVWRKRIGNPSSFKVGLVWSGSRNRVYRLSNRSIELRLLEPILKLPADFFSLQKDCSELDLLAMKELQNLKSYQEYFHDFSDTAGLIESLDLVISIDTSVAHLAAAMGKPTWILVRYESDFRWMLDRLDSPWYPSVSLFRQKKKDDWQCVIEEVSRSLSTLLTEKFN